MARVTLAQKNPTQYFFSLCIYTGPVISGGLPRKLVSSSSPSSPRRQRWKFATFKRAHIHFGVRLSTCIHTYSIQELQLPRRACVIPPPKNAFTNTLLLLYNYYDYYYEYYYVPTKFLRHSLQKKKKTLNYILLYLLSCVLYTRWRLRFSSRNLTEVVKYTSDLLWMRSICS